MGPDRRAAGPAIETRLAILRKKARGMIKLPDEDLRFLANRIREHVRPIGAH